jgi:hypothetical protein
MQRLRRTENCAAERMSDHDVVADFDGEQRPPYEYDMSWQTTPFLASRISGSRRGKS